MKIRVYENKVEISGYVNAVERVSKKIYERGEAFYEKIKEGAFGEALTRNNNVKLLLNHDFNRELATIGENLELVEDSIGLHARATVTDEEVVEKARNGKLVGWSFGFSSLRETDDGEYRDSNLRTIEAMNLYEVSILDSDHTPAYNAMSVDVRSNGQSNIEVRYEKQNINIENKEELQKREQPEFDNSIFIGKIEKFMKERIK